MVGVAVGLGNIWRFPYMMGTYGGSAFLLIYVIFTLLLAFPALLTEMVLGKKSKTGTLSAYESIFGNQFGTYIGYLLIGVVTIAGSYYAVVVANVFFSTAFSIFIGFSEESNDQYHELLGNGLLQYGCTVALIILSLYVVYRGLKSGIERISRIIMPVFLLTMLYMIGYAWTMPGVLKTVGEFMMPNFGAIGATEIFAALGQSFFSIGLGGTFVVVYSTYISSNKDIPKIAMLTCAGDLGSSLLVSMFLIPSILVLGMELNAGPSLIFNTFPELFAALPAGRLIGSMFLISVSLVAFLSLIAAFQVPITSLQKFNNSKKKFIIGFGILQIILAFPSAIFPDIIGILDLIFGSGMQVFGSFLAVLGIWWGAKNDIYRKMIFRNPESRLAKISVFWVRFIVPGTLLAVLIGYIYTSIF